MLTGSLDITHHVQMHILLDLAPAAPLLLTCCCAALCRALLSLALSQEAGLLGSAWPIMLRTISGLDALEEELTRPLPQQPAPEPPPQASNPFSRMFSALGIGPSKPEAQQPAQQQPVGYTSSSRADRARQAFKNLLQPLDALLEKPSRPKEVVVEKLAVREAPGASLVIWSGSEVGRRCLLLLIMMAEAQIVDAA
jgi:hypothetical protein